MCVDRRSSMPEWTFDSVDETGWANRFMRQLRFAEANTQKDLVPRRKSHRCWIEDIEAIDRCRARLPLIDMSSLGFVASSDSWPQTSLTG